MALPKGWHDSQWSALGKSIQENRPVECDHCTWKGMENDAHPFWEISDLHERLSPGAPVPVGECPYKDDAGEECRALVYYSDVEIAYRPAPGLLEQFIEAVDDE